MFGGIFRSEVLQRRVITRSLLIRGTASIFSIIITSEINYRVRETSEAIVALMVVFIVWRMCLTKSAWSGLLSLLSDTKKDW